MIMLNCFKKAFVLIGIAPTLFSCNHTTTKVGQSAIEYSFEQQVKQLAEDRYPSYSVVFNQDSTAAAVVDQVKFKPGVAHRNFRFFLCLHPELDAQLEDHVQFGILYWKNEDLLIVEKYPGEVDDDQPPDLGYTYDIRKKIKESR